MSRKINRTRHSRPLLVRLFMPPKGFGRGVFLRGYFKRIPVYIIFFAFAGLFITVLSSLAIGEGAYVANIPVSDTNIRSASNRIFFGHYDGHVTGTVTLDLTDFLAFFTGNPENTYINIYFPMLELGHQGGFQATGDQLTPSDPKRNFPMMSKQWNPDGSGFLRKMIGNSVQLSEISTRGSYVYSFSGHATSIHYSWKIHENYKSQIRSGEYPIFQFAIQIVESDKILWATTEGYVCRAHLDSDGDTVMNPLIVTKDYWPVINGDLVPDLIWPDDNPDHLTDGIWGELWTIRGGKPEKATGLGFLGIIGDALDGALDILGINIFDTEWAGPIRAGGIGGFIFWVTGMEFLFVDLLGLAPYVSGTNYQNTMSIGENFGFWVWKVGFDLAPALVIAGVLGWILVPMLPSLVGASLAQIIQEIPKFVITIPRRAILLLFALIGLTFSGFGLFLGLIKIGPALILFIISTMTFIYSIVSDTARFTRRTWVFVTAFPIFILGLILFTVGVGVGLFFMIGAFVVTGLEIISSPFTGLGRTVTGNKHSSHARKKNLISYKKMQRKLNIKR